MRVLVTGSRTWTWHKPVHEALSEYYEQAVGDGDRLVVVHGGAGRGADRIARDWAAQAALFGWPVDQEAHPADWSGPKRRGAGFARNAEMVALGADACLAFIRDGSHGATHCAGLAEKAGIPTHRYPWED